MRRIVCVCVCVCVCLCVSTRTIFYGLMHASNTNCGLQMCGCVCVHPHIICPHAYRRTTNNSCGLQMCVCVCVCLCEHAHNILRTHARQQYQLWLADLCVHTCTDKRFRVAGIRALISKVRVLLRRAHARA
jgi:hypothetical protein